MKEGLAAEHSGKLLGNTLEHLLNGGGVANKGRGHLEALGGDVADGRLDVIGDPLDEVRAVLVLHVEHLLIDLLGGHASTEEARGGEVASVAGVSGAHHVLGIELLLGELGNGEGAVLLGATGREGRKADHEEVKTGEGHQVDSELPKIRVELSGEAEAARGSGHGRRHEVVEVAVRGRGELQGAEADIVEGLVIEDHNLIGVLDELVHGERRVVGLDDSVGHLGGGHDGEGEHDAVGVLLADLGDEKSSHTRASATSEGVGDLEALKAVAGLSFLADDVEDGVDELRALSVVALGPVVSGAGLAEDKVIGAEELAEGSSADGVHGAGLEIHEDRAGHVAAAGSLVVVHVDALELKVGVAVVCAGRVNAVLIGDNLPELGTDLVTALASLDVNEFAHVC